MKEFIKLLEPLLRYLDIPVDLFLDGEVSYLVLLCLYYFIMSTFVLLNVLNICIYLLSIYIVSNEKFLNKIPGNYVYVHRILNYYKNIRITFIVIESLMLLFCLIIMIGLSYGMLFFFLSLNNN